MRTSQAQARTTRNEHNTSAGNKGTTSSNSAPRPTDIRAKQRRRTRSARSARPERRRGVVGERMTRGRPETSRAERTTPAGRRRDGARHGSRAAPGLLSQWHGAAQVPVFCGPRAYVLRPAAARRRSSREPGDERRPGGRNPASGAAGSRRKRQGRSGEARPGRRNEHTRHNRQTARHQGEDGNRALARYNGLAALARRRQRPGRAQGSRSTHRRGRRQRRRTNPPGDTDQHNPRSAAPQQPPSRAASRP